MTKHALVNNLLALLIMPLEILHLALLMCSLQLSLLSIVTPRNVVEDTCLIALSLISSFFGLICFLLDVLNIMYWVLSMFRDNLLAFNQATSFFSSILILLVISSN